MLEAFPFAQAADIAWNGVSDAHLICASFSEDYEWTFTFSNGLTTVVGLAQVAEKNEYGYVYWPIKLVVKGSSRETLGDGGNSVEWPALPDSHLEGRQSGNGFAGE